MESVRLTISSAEESKKDEIMSTLRKSEMYDSIVDFTQTESFKQRVLSKVAHWRLKTSVNWGFRKLLIIWEGAFIFPINRSKFIVQNVLIGPFFLTIVGKCTKKCIFGRREAAGYNLLNCSRKEA